MEGPLPTIQSWHVNKNIFPPVFLPSPQRLLFRPVDPRQLVDPEECRAYLYGFQYTADMIYHFEALNMVLVDLQRDQHVPAHFLGKRSIADADVFISTYTNHPILVKLYCPATSQSTVEYELQANEFNPTTDADGVYNLQIQSLVEYYHLVHLPCMKSYIFTTLDYFVIPCANVALACEIAENLYREAPQEVICVSRLSNRMLLVHLSGSHAFHGKLKTLCRGADQLLHVATPSEFRNSLMQYVDLGSDINLSLDPNTAFATCAWNSMSWLAVCKEIVLTRPENAHQLLPLLDHAVSLHTQSLLSQIANIPEIRFKLPIVAPHSRKIGIDIHIRNSCALAVVMDAALRGIRPLMILVETAHPECQYDINNLCNSVPAEIMRRTDLLVRLQARPSRAARRPDTQRRTESEQNLLETFSLRGLSVIRDSRETGYAMLDERAAFDAVMVRVVDRERKQMHQNDLFSSIKSFLAGSQHEMYDMIIVPTYVFEYFETSGFLLACKEGLRSRMLLSTEGKHIKLRLAGVQSSEVRSKLCVFENWTPL